MQSLLHGQDLSGGDTVATYGALASEQYSVLSFLAVSENKCDKPVMVIWYYEKSQGNIPTFLASFLPAFQS